MGPGLTRRVALGKGRTSGDARGAGELGAYGSDEHYDFVLEQLLSGLRAATASS
jgi:hypothetical protein